MMFDMLEKQLITVDTFKRNSPFAEIQDIEMGGTEHWTRAQLVNVILEERWETFMQMTDPFEIYGPADGLVVTWQDDPFAHKNALLEIILDDHKPAELRKLAMDRWGVYDNLERAHGHPEQGLPPTAAPLPFIQGVPMDLMPQQPQPAAGAFAQPQADSLDVAGAGGAPGGIGTSPAPNLSPIATEASQQVAEPLGTLGAVEESR
jgi:hypothetical protein